MRPTVQTTLPILALCILLLLAGCQSDQYEKVPITTQSDEALKYFLRGRNFYDKLRRADAEENFRKAIELDPEFALAHLHYALIAPNTQTFTEHMDTAVELADKVSTGEKYKILGLQAFFNGQPDKEGENYRKLVQDYPNDERAQLLLGNHYFFQNDFNRAIGYYRRAIQINPKFSLSYNQLGYCHRFLENYEEAENAFKEYIKLVPEDPNPYDSYGDLLTKMGRFEESIAMYEKALTQDPNFVYSYIGISTNLNLLGQYKKGRQRIKNILPEIDEENQQRMLLYALMISFLDEESNDSALSTMQQIIEFDISLKDTLHIAEDYFRLADIFTEFRQYDKARDKVEMAYQIINNSQISSELKNATHISYLFRITRLEIKTGNFEKATEYLSQVEEEISRSKDRNRTQSYHGLLGMLALETGEYDRALGEFQRSNRLNPFVLFYTAIAYEKKGDISKAAKFYTETANFNASGNMYFALVRKDARRKLEKIKS